MYKSTSKLLLNLEARKKVIKNTQMGPFYKYINCFLNTNLIRNSFNKSSQKNSRRINYQSLTVKQLKKRKLPAFE